MVERYTSHKLIVISIVVYAITTILRYTNGPFNVFQELRIKVGIPNIPEYNTKGDLVDIIDETPRYDQHLANLFSCFWCLATWISLVVNLLLRTKKLEFFVLWIGSIGIAGFLNEHS